MEKELDPVVIKTTQTSLGKYVKRPPLSEKLLKKPPFRFLHDIVTNVLKTTGFFEGLFDEEELISDNVKDRESKILFLNKVITVVGLTTGKSLSVKPSKIVAGQEPEKTNELLQYLAQALDDNLSSNEAVKKYKEGTKKTKTDVIKTKELSKPLKKPNESNKFSSKSTEKLTSQKKDSNVKARNDVDNVNKSKQKEKGNVKTEAPTKKTSLQKKTASINPSIENKTHGSDEIGAHTSLSNESNHLQTEIANEQFPKQEKQSDTEITKTSADINASYQDQNEQNLNSSYTITENNLNSSLTSQDIIEPGLEGTNETIVSEFDVLTNGTFNQDEKKKNNDENEQNASNLEKVTIETKNEHHKNENQNQITKSPAKVKHVVRPLSVRPSSSRPGAPRLREKHDNFISETENILIGKVNIIVENTPNEEEEDTSIIIVEREGGSSKLMLDDQEQLQASLNEHGHLVQQILDSQKEFTHLAGKTEIEWEFGAKKARDATGKEIEQLRFDIQALSRAANPLGKLMDHIQEDVEVMRQELQQWTKTYEEASKELLKQKAVNEDSLSSLYTKVKQLDADMKEKNDKINDLKIILHKNTFRIEKLLANGNVQ